MKTERSRQRQRNLAQHFLSIRNINLIYLPTCKTTRNKKQNISKQTSSRSGLSVCDSKAWLMKPWLGSSSLLCNWLKSGFVAPGDDLASSSSWAGNSYSAGVLFASGVTYTGALKIIVIMMMTEMILANVILVSGKTDSKSWYQWYYTV